MEKRWNQVNAMKKIMKKQKRRKCNKNVTTTKNIQKKKLMSVESFVVHESIQKGAILL